MKQFDFGKNWKDYSDKALTAEKIKHAEQEFLQLFEGIELQGKTFLDIGFGQGLSLLVALKNGAIASGNDINPICREVLTKNVKWFDKINLESIRVIIGSILDEDIIQQIKKTGNNELYDIVHSWGVLHHTGNMWLAFDHAVSLVKPEGYFVVAIYNRHWTSSSWLWVKKRYNKSSRFIKRLLEWFFGMLFIFRLLLSGQNPFKRQRGMSFYYDLVDWLGGYPYEFAGKNEIVEFMKSKGFSLMKFIPTQGFTGCNQFVFKHENLRRS